MAKERIEWIDLAKGLSIILVVYGHTGLNGVPYIGDWFASFRMPFFFFVSGILFSPSKYVTIGAFLKRRWKTLIRPYFFFSAIVAVIMYLIDDNFNLNCIKEILIKGWGGIALWFIPVLLITSLLWYVINKYIQDKRWLLLSMLLIGVIGFISYKFKFPNNYNIWFSLTAVLFYGSGNLLNVKLRNLQSQSSKQVLVIMLVSIVVSLTYLLNDKPEFSTNNLAKLYTYPAAIGGTLFMCMLSSIISRYNVKPIRTLKNIVIFFGKNSYIVLAFHQVVIMSLKDFGYTTSGSILRISMWIVLVLLIYIINKYLPFIIGKENKIFI